VLARILAQSEAENVFGQGRTLAEAEVEVARARAALEAVLNTVILEMQNEANFQKRATSARGL
jgi:hypothetical protein